MVSSWVQLRSPYCFACKASQPAGSWGCSKCRQNPQGCLACCPWKAGRYSSDGAIHRYLCRRSSILSWSPGVCSVEHLAFCMVFDATASRQPAEDRRPSVLVRVLYLRTGTGTRRKQRRMRARSRCLALPLATCEALADRLVRIGVVILIT